MVKDAERRPEQQEHESDVTYEFLDLSSRDPPTCNHVSNRTINLRQSMPYWPKHARLAIELDTQCLTMSARFRDLVSDQPNSIQFAIDCPSLVVDFNGAQTYMITIVGVQKCNWSRIF
jgi:hypothetical protein